MSIDQLTHHDFEPYLNDIFLADYGGDSPLELTLASVSTLGQPPQPGENRRQAFSLLFQNPTADKYLIQQIYQVAHPQMGTLSLFLVPLGPSHGRMQYEAIFT